MFSQLVTNPTRVQNQVWDQVLPQVQDQVWLQVEDQLWRQVNRLVRGQAQ